MAKTHDPRRQGSSDDTATEQSPNESAIVCHYGRQASVSQERLQVSRA
jgi:hypothetical protein